MSIPVIDMQKDTAAKDLVNAFETIGFATLIHHGVEQKVMESAFQSSKRFFELSEKTKLESKYKSHSSNRGYIPFQAECHVGLNDMDMADFKETFDIGWDKDVSPDLKTPWPTKEYPQMEGELMDYFTQCETLQLKVLRLLGEGMNLEDPDFFVQRCNEKHCNLRLLHYPSVESSQYRDHIVTTAENDGKDPQSVLVRGLRHTDYGTITLLAQDSIGGLRVQPRTGNYGENDWIPVPPVPYSFVVNVGDMLQRWTNDRLVATPHQVVHYFHERGEAEDDFEPIQERFSIAFFCNANKSVSVDPNNLLGEGEVAKYEPVISIDYLTKRLAATINTENENREAK